MQKIYCCGCSKRQLNHFMEEVCRLMQQLQVNMCNMHLTYFYELTSKGGDWIVCRWACSTTWLSRTIRCSQTSRSMHIARNAHFFMLPVESVAIQVLFVIDHKVDKIAEGVTDISQVRLCIWPNGMSDSSSIMIGSNCNRAEPWGAQRLGMIHSSTVWDLERQHMQVSSVTRKQKREAQKREEEQKNLAAATAYSADSNQSDVARTCCNNLSAGVLFRRSIWHMSAQTC